jgi:hypothetical protein
VPFAATWNALQAQLAAGTTIPNWTAARGPLGDSFIVTRVGARHVEVSAPGAQTIQTVPERDFQLVYSVWQPYCQGRVSRAEIRDMTRFSKYVISILHWLEGQCGGRLP